MRKILTYAVSSLALASCSSDSLVSDSPANTQAPIAFNVGQKNITRTTTPTGDPLQSKGYDDFGVWAYKYKTGSSAALVMDNYKVGHKEENSAVVWYYDGIGSQILRYWDHSTEKTNFYAYAPYNSSVNFDVNDKKINVTATAGYKSTNDFIYAGTSVENDDYDKKVKLVFRHIGAKVNVAFRENVPGYKVQLIDVTTTDKSGIQATPAVETVTGTGSTAVTSYSVGEYNTTSSVTITYDDSATPSTTTSTSGATTSPANLKFEIPTEVSDNDLVSYTNTKTNKNYNVLREGTDAKYVVSPTTYYAVVQPSDNPGFTFHVSYKLIAEDNGEEIIVRDARVFVPADLVRWESNKAYTYNFTISTSSTGNTSGTVKETEPDVPADKALNPIVFDNPTIVDYSDVSDAQDI